MKGWLRQKEIWKSNYFNNQGKDLVIKNIERDKCLELFKQYEQENKEIY